MARVHSIFTGNQNFFWKEATGAPTASTLGLDEIAEAADVGWSWTSRNFSSVASSTFLVIAHAFQGRETMGKTVFTWHHHLSSFICICVLSLTLGFFWEEKTGDTFDSGGRRDCGCKQPRVQPGCYIARAKVGALRLPSPPSSSAPGLAASN